MLLVGEINRVRLLNVNISGFEVLNERHETEEVKNKIIIHSHDSSTGALKLL